MESNFTSTTRVNGNMDRHMEFFFSLLPPYSNRIDGEMVFSVFLTAAHAIDACCR